MCINSPPFLCAPSGAENFPKRSEKVAVTAKRKVVTYRKQASRMASFGAVRNDREPLSNPYQTHDLCPADLCPENRKRAESRGFITATLTAKCFPEPTSRHFVWSRARGALLKLSIGS